MDKPLFAAMPAGAGPDDAEAVCRRLRSAREALAGARIMGTRSEARPWSATPSSAPASPRSPSYYFR